MFVKFLKIMAPFCYAKFIELFFYFFLLVSLNTVGIFKYYFFFDGFSKPCLNNLLIHSASCSSAELLE